MKKAAPAKENGLHNTQPNISSFDMKNHETFLMDEVLPLVIGYAHHNNHPTEAAALATMAAMTTILTSKGYTLKELSSFLASFTAHDAPEALQ